MGGVWTVHKFGGTSLADAAAFRRAGRIVVDERTGQTAVVVSAMAGVTDALIALARLAAARDASWREALERLGSRVLAVIHDLLPGEPGEHLASTLHAEIAEIAELVQAAWLLRSPTPGMVEVVSGYGELWSARMLAAHLAAEGRRATWLDARQVLVVVPDELGPAIDWDGSRRRLTEWRERLDDEIVIITGYIASNSSGAPTTLGRNGSDYSASIFAALLGAASITIWTDVSGVYSADPRLVSDARLLPALSYDEAMELAYFGAKVIHPRTMAPAIEAGIPIRIRNTFRPQDPGSVIGVESVSAAPVKGFASVQAMALVNVEGGGMVGVPGVAERLFGALRTAGVSVVLISQGSSEHSICFAVPEAQAETARRAVERAFFAERHQGQIRAPNVVTGCAVLAAVGDGMAGTPGIAGKFFGALAKAGVNLRAIAQGASERNISVVIDDRDSARALRAAHAGFYLSNQTLSVGLLGPGLVGGTLLDQMARQIESLRETLHVDLRVRAIVGRDRMRLEDAAIALEGWRAAQSAAQAPTDIDAFVEHVQTDAVPHAVLIDCTAESGIAARHADWLERGIHVVTPNKKGITLDMAYYRRLQASRRTLRLHYLYEATVGAGLPVIQTLRDLCQTGDRVLRIEGILSGTLSYLFNAYDGTRPFSAIVREARSRGYTEPDPREDLAGTDVARKVVILAREMGLEVELEDVAVESLVPAELGSESVDGFLERLADHDARMRELFDEARAAGEVLRFVGTVDPEAGCAVRLRRYPLDHPFARLALSDNIVQFRSERYLESPLVIRGPGAGPQVTAGGVFADLLRLAAYLGGPL